MGKSMERSLLGKLQNVDTPKIGRTNLLHTRHSPRQRGRPLCNGTVQKKNILRRKRDVEFLHNPGPKPPPGALNQRALSELIPSALNDDPSII